MPFSVSWLRSELGFDLLGHELAWDVGRGSGPAGPKRLTVCHFAPSPRAVLSLLGRAQAFTVRSKLFPETQEGQATDPLGIFKALGFL